MKQAVAYTALVVALLITSILLVRYIEWSNRIEYVAPVIVVKASYIKKKPETSINAVLDAVGACEGVTQFTSDGSVVKHVNTNGTIDYGVMQINSTHIKEAQKMGIDIMTKEGNRKYAEYLYAHQGTAPWTASQKCWGVMI